MIKGGRPRKSGAARPAAGPAGGAAAAGQARPAAEAAAGPAFPYEERLVSEAARLSGRSGFDQAAAAADLLALQRGLTGERRLIGGAYMDERRALASYLLFYWPVSYAQTRAMLSMARLSGGRPLRVLDLGSGPAPCSIAAADLLGGSGTAITACDRSPLALEIASRLAASAGYRFAGVPGWDALSGALPEGPFDLVVLGHVLNELRAGREDRLGARLSLLDAALARLSPGGALLFLEPALLSTGRDAIALRDRLAAAGRRILAPCLRQGPCPALESEGQTCHSDFAWEVPPVVRELSRRTGLGKDLVKTTAFVVAPGCAESGLRAATSSADSADSADEDGGGEYRVVSDPMLNKAGRVRLLLCGASGRFPLSAKRGEGFPAEAAFFALRRSDRVVLRAPARRENGVALGAGTAIEIDK